MLIHGNNDAVVPVDASINMYKQLAADGAKVEMNIYEGAAHAFDAAPEFGHQIADMIALWVDRQVNVRSK